jgi:hypothetical protein
VKHEFLDKINLLEPVHPGARLPDSARARSNYNAVLLRLAGEAESYRPPGTVGRSVPDMWRRNIAWKVAAALTVLSSDRPLQLSHFPVDAAKAEALTKKMASFSARVYIDAERAIAYDSGNKGIISSSLLTVRLKKVEVIGPDQEILATFGPEQLN